MIDSASIHQVNASISYNSVMSYFHFWYLYFQQERKIWLIHLAMTYVWLIHICWHDLHLIPESSQIFSCASYFSSFIRPLMFPTI